MSLRVRDSTTPESARVDSCKDLGKERGCVQNFWSPFVSLKKKNVIINGRGRIETYIRSIEESVT